MIKDKPAINRTSFTDWNPNAELFAFGKRLSEDFRLPVLQQAFIHPSYIEKELKKQKEIGIEEPAVEIQDNSSLVDSGTTLLHSCVSAFVKGKLASGPSELHASVVEYLTSNELISKLARNLGAVELILSADEPLQEITLANTFRAIVAALAESSGQDRANTFIHDFVCTSLNQLDITEQWKIEDPVQELDKLCASRNLSAPEPRLIGQCGTNTLLASYNVGIYSDKKMIGSGFGETLDIAISEASLDAIRGLYKIRSHQQFIKF